MEKFDKNIYLEYTINRLNFLGVYNMAPISYHHTIDGTFYSETPEPHNTDKEDERLFSLWQQSLIVVVAGLLFLFSYLFVPDFEVPTKIPFNEVMSFHQMIAFLPLFAAIFALLSGRLKKNEFDSLCIGFFFWGIFGFLGVMSIYGFWVIAFVILASGFYCYLGETLKCSLVNLYMARWGVEENTPNIQMVFEWAIICGISAYFWFVTAAFLLRDSDILRIALKL